MNDLPDESLALALSYLPTADVVHISIVSTHMRPVSRSDRLWLPLLCRRWRFGALPATADVLSPGKREVASECALAKAESAPVCSSSDVFDFYVKRRQQEIDVALLVMQFVAAPPEDEDGEGPKRCEGLEGLMPGFIVQVRDLRQAGQYNGQVGVVGGIAKGSQDRFDVTLAPSFKNITVRLGNLTVKGAPISAAEVLRRVMEIGDDAIDALLRLCLAGVATPASLEPRVNRHSVAAAARKLQGFVMEQWAVRQWGRLKDDQQRVDNLEEGGLVVAMWAEAPIVDVAAVRATLASLAESAARRTPSGASLRERVEIINQVLFQEQGFAGNKECYYDPRNSLLHAVLERKVGIPISLSIVWAVLARRLDVPCHLCARMPAHVLIRVTTGRGVTEDLYVDAFNRKIMDYTGLISFASSIIPHTFQAEWVSAGPATSIYGRVLRNLIGIYQESFATHHSQGELPEMICCLQLFAGACAQAAAVSDTEGEREEFQRQREAAVGLMAKIPSDGFAT